MEYGSDEEYMVMVEQAREGWIAWNDLFGRKLYHETGVAMLTRSPMAPGGFEYESYQLMLKRGHSPQRLNSQDIARRFPAWNAGKYVDGYFHAKGGYAESGLVVSALLELAHQRKIDIHSGQTMDGFIEQDNRVMGVHTRQSESFYGGQVIMAAGTWTHLLVPDLAPSMRSVGQPVFHLKPTDPALFSAPIFPVFTADITQTGWYGFPYHPTEGVIKVANHGVGWPLHPENDERVVSDVQPVREFLAETFPSLADAPITYTRCCVYCDTLDEHFWIDHHPSRPGLMVASGGSGHGFKFAPVLGSLIADVAEGLSNPFAHKFRWRDLTPNSLGQEAARHHVSLPS
jgi:glycine/D-amino acid oxidase-like deaminating enzyme